MSRVPWLVPTLMSHTHHVQIEICQSVESPATPYCPEGSVPYDLHIRTNIPPVLFNPILGHPKRTCVVVRTLHAGPACPKPSQRPFIHMSSPESITEDNTQKRQPDSFVGSSIDWSALIPASDFPADVDWDRLSASGNAKVPPAHNRFHFNPTLVDCCRSYVRKWKQRSFTSVALRDSSCAEMARAKALGFPSSFWLVLLTSNWICQA